VVHASESLLMNARQSPDAVEVMARAQRVHRPQGADGARAPLCEALRVAVDSPLDAGRDGGLFLCYNGKGTGNNLVGHRRHAERGHEE